MKIFNSLLLALVLASPAAFAQDPVKPGVEQDHEFDAGSRIAIAALSPVQIDNLATLGKVWGFLKYHHPLITSGQRQWDHELLRIMPAVLAAPDRAAAQGVLHDWIASLGKIADCAPCASLAAGDLHLRPALEWLDDRKLLGAHLQADLRHVYRNRPAIGRQYYLSLAKGIGNPVFDTELPYPNVRFPDAGFQLLALFRFWNIVEYWAPYRDVIGERWDDVLQQSIARLALAKDRNSYQLELMTVIARIHDTHANLWSSMAVRPPVGDCYLPVNLRFVGQNAVVAGYAEQDKGLATGLQVGDIIEAMDNVPVATLVQTWSPHYAASNQPTRLRDIGRGMVRGSCGETRIRVRRAAGEQEIPAQRTPVPKPRPAYARDKAGETFQLLTPEIAYLKLSSVKRADIQAYLTSARATKGLIIDIRNYPSEFVVFALGQHLIERPSEFVRFTVGDLNNPGAFGWEAPLALQPKQPHYAGKVMILVDETTQSQAEYTTMAFRTATGAKVIGSTTAAADGNVSKIALPGNLRAMISGIGVFYPDKRPTQRVGIIPDIQVLPSIQGIRAGRDEVLEAAIAEIERK